MDNPFKSPTIISFCTGGRMLERGLERAIGSFTVAAYVEIEAFCIFNLVTQMEQGMVDPAPVWTDAKTFPSSYFHGKIHGIIGGYPCQPFSLAGKRKGEADPRHLWPYLRRHIEAIRPVWCFFENVDDHITMGFDTVYQELSDLGYAVEIGIYSAEEVGAPQERLRLFILALADPTGGEAWRLPIRKEAEESGPAISHKKMADAICNYECEVQNKKREPIVGQKLICNSHQGRDDRFPLGQGYEQHEWEEPRTVKSGMGCTVNGYNFTEDILRMLGNGVVEQTAAVAFADLLQKYLKTN